VGTYQKDLFRGFINGEGWGRRKRQKGGAKGRGGRGRGDKRDILKRISRIPDGKVGRKVTTCDPGIQDRGKTSTLLLSRL